MLKIAFCCQCGVVKDFAYLSSLICLLLPKTIVNRSLKKLSSSGNFFKQLYSKLKQFHNRKLPFNVFQDFLLIKTLQFFTQWIAKIQNTWAFPNIKQCHVHENENQFLFWYVVDSSNLSRRKVIAELFIETFVQRLLFKDKRDAASTSKCNNELC